MGKPITRMTQIAEFAQTANTLRVQGASYTISGTGALQIVMTSTVSMSIFIDAFCWRMGFYINERRLLAGDEVRQRQARA